MSIDLNEVVDTTVIANIAIPEDASEEVTNIIEQHNKEVTELKEQAAADLDSSTNELLVKIEASLTAAFTGANDSITSAKARITEILSKYEVGSDPAQYTADDSAELVQLSRIIGSANIVIGAVTEVSTQESFLQYVKNSPITAAIGATPNLIFKEYEKLRHFLRKHRISEFQFDAVFKLTEKYNHSPAIRNCNVTLYCFFRYLNELNSKGKLVENFIYAKYTAAVITAGYVSGKQLNLTTAILSTIPAR